MPVGTAGTVKGLTPGELVGAQSQIVLAKPYHLWLRPGLETILGRWRTSSLHGLGTADSTDSGGFRFSVWRADVRSMTTASPFGRISTQRTSLYAGRASWLFKKPSGAMSQWCSCLREASRATK